MADSQFTFNISLSVLNHLGRNLYRSFLTVLGEGISNAWDANAENVWIYIDKKANRLVIVDDGDGMSETDFQDKFLKIGYSKRKERSKSPGKNRPFIGRKGIGKLALLSCADKITIISKKLNGKYVGGCIDNSGLDKAILHDLTPDKYPLETWNEGDFAEYTKNHAKGTIIIFENLKDGIKNTLQYLRKAIALYFRFSLKDSKFNIHLDDNPITIEDLGDLATKTEYLWKINDLKNDKFLTEKLTKPPLKRDPKSLGSLVITGFIASVTKPSALKIYTTEERVSVDLFVNGRLREKDILKHIPTTRIVESYLYGQLHADYLDDKIDRFTSSREGMVADDPEFLKILNEIKDNILPIIFNDWDLWRIEDNKDGDPDNPRITKKARKSRELFNAVSEEYKIPEDNENKKKVDSWVSDLGEDAQFNFTSYAECFISENLIRNYIDDKKIDISKAKVKIDEWKKREVASKGKGNISIDIRKNASDLSYLDMDGLANLVDKVTDQKKPGLSRDASEYKPIRDALAHTALLTDVAKNKLSAVYENIRARVIKLFE